MLGVSDGAVAELCGVGESGFTYWHDVQEHGANHVTALFLLLSQNVCSVALPPPSSER